MKSNIDIRIKEMRQNKRYWTTKDLSDGKVAIEYQGDLFRLGIVLKESYPYAIFQRYVSKYYYTGSSGIIWIGINEKPDIPTVSETEIKLKSEL